MLLIAFVLFDFSFASSFSPHCSLPSEGTNFVFEPDSRGTLTIFWSCISIIIICTWNILHLNIPEERPRPRNYLQKLWWLIVGSQTQVKWMLFTILVPEFLVGKAFNDWMAAKATAIDMSELAAKDGVEWEGIHCYFCNMGGFVVDFSLLARANLQENEKPSITPAPTSNQSILVEESITTTQPVQILEPELSSAKSKEDRVQRTLIQVVNQVLGNPERVSRTQEINLSRMMHTQWALDGCQMAYARSEGIIASLPKVPARDLEKLNKGDALIKFLAVIQVLWLIIQLIARKVVGLPSSQLEISTLAFSASSLITYSFFWNRPRGVTTVITVPAVRFPSVQDLLYLSRNGPRYLWTGPRVQGKTYGERDLVRIPNDAFPDIWNVIPYSKESCLYNLTGGNEEVLSSVFGTIIGGTIFGGLHCLAWNLHFPSHTEKIMWRVCSILITALPTSSIPFIILWARYNGIEVDQVPISPWKRHLVASVLLLFFAIPYIVSRFFLIVGIFRSLFFLPSEAFIDTWSAILPH